MKMTPLNTSRATNADLRDRIIQLHDCFEASALEAKRTRKKMERDIEEIKTHVGIGKRGAHRPLLAMSQWGALARVVPVVGGLAILWQLIVSIWPSIFALLKAISTFLLHH